MDDAFCFDELHSAVSPAPVTILLEVSAAEVELAFATNGASLRRPMMHALLMALIVDADSAPETASH